MRLRDKRRQARPSPARRRFSWASLRKRYENSGKGSLSPLQSELWALKGEVDFQKLEVERLNHVVRHQKWAIGELVDYLDAELRPGQLSSWQRYRRLISRFREG